jgi:hypothetical protein
MLLLARINRLPTGVLYRRALQPVTRMNETARYRLSGIGRLEANDICKVNPNDEGAHNGNLQDLLIEIVNEAHTIRT